MDYTIFATGPNGEQIYNDSNGQCYFLNSRGGYEPLYFEQMTEEENSNYSPVMTNNFSTSGSFYINGEIISPSDCSYANSTMYTSSEVVHGGGGQRYSSSSLNDVGGSVTSGFSSLVSDSFQRGESLLNANLLDANLRIESSPSGALGYDFTMDSEEQKNLSSQLSVAAESFEQKVTLMYREIGNMANYWVGEDYDTYVHATDGYKTALGDLADSLRMYGKHFDQMSLSTEELTSELIEIIETCTNRHVR